MGFGVFDAAVGSDVEVALSKQASVDKMAAAVYDVREQLGPVLFASRDMDEFNHKIAMMKADQSLFKVIEASGLFPLPRVMRQVTGKLKEEFASHLAMRKGAPFAGYEDFDDCTSKNSDKGDPDAYCGEIKHRTEDKKESRRRRANPMGGPAPTVEPAIGPYVDPGSEFTHDHLDNNYGPQTELGRGMPNQALTGGRRQSVYDTIDHPKWDNGTVDTNETFQGGQTDKELKPKGDFKGYLKKMDQGAPEKIKRNFTGEPVGTHTEDPAKHNFASKEAVNVYLDWCKSHNLSAARLSSLDRYAANLSSDQYFRLANVILAWENEHKPKVPSTKLKAKDKVARREVNKHRYAMSYLAWCRKHNLAPADASNLRHYGQRTARVSPEGFRYVANILRRVMVSARAHYAAPDYLQKADDALTQLLNQKAQEFQETIAPLQQALITVQQAEQLQQQQNPLNVLPTPGTVNVMPGQPNSTPGQLGMPDPNSPDISGLVQALQPGGGAMGGVAPQGDTPAGGASPDAGAPPPAAAGGGLPPDLDQSAGQKAARRGKGKGAARSRQAGGVGEQWDRWRKRKEQSGDALRGGDVDYEQFRNETGVGDRALRKLKQRNQTPDFEPINGGRPAKPKSPPEGITVGSRMHKACWPGCHENEAHAAKFHKDKKESRRWEPHLDDDFEPDATKPAYPRKAQRKQAWSGWGPAQVQKTRHVAGWDWNDHQNGYLASSPRHFECSCGDQFPTPSGFHRCACGKQWNSYVIGTGGGHKEASADTFIVREVPVRPDVIVANRKLTQNRAVSTKAHQLVDPRTGGIVKLVDPGEVGEGDDPGHPTFKKQPKDWARRGDGGKWTPSAIG